MGLILDSSVLIAAERKGQNARQALTEVARRTPGEDVALSVITLMELARGAARADSPERKTMRQQFLDELVVALPVHPVTVAIALRAGHLDGENTAKGMRLALADLLIGATAPELGYRVATGNVRNSDKVPGLEIISSEPDQSTGEGYPKDHMKRLLLTLLLATLAVPAQQPLTQIRELPLTNFDGRIDHMAFDATQHRLFLTGIRTNQVLVLDLATAKELHRISGLSEPQGVLFLPASNHLFVTNGGTGDVNLYDAGTFALLQTTRLKGDADNIRLDPATGNVLVGYGEGDHSGIAILNQTGAVTGIIPLNNHPESFQVDPAHDRIYINVPSSSKIVAATLSSHQLLTDYQAHGNFPLALSPDGHALFTGERHPGHLAQYDTETGKLTATLPLADDCDDLFLDPATHRLFATSGSGAISIYNLGAADHLTPGPSVPTAPGARTSLLIPDLHQFLVAAPASGSQPARIIVFQIEPTH